jgi:uncharacterized protein (DUF58 family)
LILPTTWVRRRFQRWFEARLPLTDTTVLTQRNVFILPTRPGLMLGATLLVLLVASINYQLNLGYLLTFLLAGSAVVGMHVCHGTLRGITMNLIATEPLFLRATATFGITLHSKRRVPRYGIGLSVQGADHWVWTDVPGQGSATVHLSFKPARRGWNRLPTLTAETRFPLGTFRVWTVWRPAAQVLVYPSPEASPAPLPPGEPRPGTGAAAQFTQAGGESDGVRAYRRGDPLKLIVWKKAARSGELVSRDASQVQRAELWLDLQRTGWVHPEQQLSRLCAWVLQAEQRGLRYGLRLGALEIKPDSGEAHRQRCLQALALY